ncbi:MAG: threonine synthase [Acidimicrobiia bacterium]|nr:threonine synthase [Acidimicrobiia bacterium]
MADVKALRCRECGAEYDAGALYACEWCFGPLECVYDYGHIADRIDRAAIERGPRSLWRYQALLPVAGVPKSSLPTGFTPLVRASRLGAELGLRELYIKDDTRNPTNSFKDRVTAVALAKAIELGFETIACASTGNLANAVAGHAASAGLRSYVFVPASIEQAKITATGVFGGTVVAVDGNYDDVNRLCAEVAGTHPWAFVNVNLRPYYAEGSKSLAFETVEQLGWRAPDHCIVPVGSGSLLTKIKKGLDELHKVWLLEEQPRTRISGAQASGCAPVATAWAEDWELVKPVKPDTIAKSIAIGDPADGVYAIDVVKETDGAFAAVSDDETVEGIKLLARTEGIFTETAGGVTVAALAKLAAEGVIRPDECIVAYITGHGLKTLDAVHSEIETLKTTPRLEDFSAALERAGIDPHAEQSARAPVMPFASAASRFTESAD